MTLSVALCTYNGQSFLSEQLNSILNQTHPVDEIIICDDCSTDQTIEIIKDFKDKFPNLIQLFENENSLGTIKNFEKAISLTKGDLIFLSDQDDIWRKDKVEIMSCFFQENNTCKLLFTDGDLIDENSDKLNATLWQKWNFNADIQNKWKNNLLAFGDLIQGINKITGATVCFSKTLKAKIIPINLPINYWHDGWVGLHASAIEGLAFIEETLIQYRIHKNQQIGISTNVQREITFRANEKFISRDKYFNKIRTMYPNLKELIPRKKPTFFERLFVIIKSYFKQ